MSTLMIPIEEACRELQCSEDTLRVMIAAGTIPAAQPGKSTVLNRQAFNEAVYELCKAEATKKKRATPLMVQPYSAEKRKPGRPRRQAPMPAG